jgi:hypothetical protein
MDLKAVGWGGMDWVAVAKDWDKWRVLVNAVMDLCSIKCGEFDELRTG